MDLWESSEGASPSLRNSDMRKTLRRWPAGAKIAQRIASWTWDVTHERALSPADLFGGKAPVGALIGLLERIR
jgi:hypothetical protein